MTLMGVMTIVAILVGPSIAVWITRKIDDERAAKARKMDIFRTLMQTRGMPTQPEHVGALNLVEVEFSNHKDVIDRWKEYFEHLNTRPPQIPDDLNAFGKNRETLLTMLISEIGKTLGFEITQLDILRGNYVPSGWWTVDDEQRLLRRGLLDVISGKVPIPIKIHENDTPPPGGRP